MKLLHPLLDIWGFFRVPKGQVFRGEKKSCPWQNGGVLSWQNL